MLSDNENIILIVLRSQIENLGYKTIVVTKICEEFSISRSLVWRYIENIQRKALMVF